jgi:hypothetical protein
VQLEAWLTDLDEALSQDEIDESSTVVALYRVPELSVDSEDGWDARPVVALERDEEDIDLLTYGASGTALTVADLRDWYSRNSDCGQCELFVPDLPVKSAKDSSYRRDVPAIAMVLNKRLSQFGVIVWYEDCDSELG